MKIKPKVPLFRIALIALMLTISTASLVIIGLGQVYGFDASRFWWALLFCGISLVLNIQKLLKGN